MNQTEVNNGELTLVKSESRVLYFDVIRVISVYMAIIIHVSMAWWGTSKVDSASWANANFFNSLSRIGVPLLVMISGALIINSPKPAKLKKRITRIIKAYIFWSFLYAAEFVIFEDYNGSALVEFAKQFVMGHYHLWFCFMIVGLYLVLPFVDSFCRSNRLMTYFLGLWAIFAIFIPTIRLLPGMEKLSILTDKMFLYLPLGYLGYWVLGFYLSMEDCPLFHKKKRVLYTTIAIICTGITFVGSYAMSNISGQGNAVLFDYFMPNVAIGATAFFLCIRAIQELKLKFDLSHLADNSFAIYLMSDFFVIIIKRMAVSQQWMASTSLLIPIYAFFVMLLCNMIARIMRKVPFLRKNVL